MGKTWIAAAALVTLLSACHLPVNKERSEELQADAQEASDAAEEEGLFVIEDWGELDEFLTAHADEVASRCPGSTLELLERDDTSALFDLHTVNCPEGVPETAVGRVLDGEENRFVVQYAVREPLAMDEARHSEWVEKLLEMEILVR